MLQLTTRLEVLSQNRNGTMMVDARCSWEAFARENKEALGDEMARIATDLEATGEAMIDNGAGGVAMVRVHGRR